MRNTPSVRASGTCSRRREESVRSLASSGSSDCASANSRKSTTCRGRSVSVESIVAETGEGVCCCIGRPLYMAQISGKLTDEVEVPDLPRRMPIQAGGECKSEGLMIGKDVKLSPFQEVPEMLDSQVYGQELTIVHTISCF